MEMKSLWIVVGAIVILGLGWWLLTAMPQGFGQNATTTVTGTNGTSNTTGSSAASGTSSFAELANRNGSSECEVTTTSGGVATAGTVYVSGGQVRGDFQTTVAGRTVNSHMIQTGGFIYTWSNISNQGFKSPVNVSATSQATSTAGFNPLADVQYECQPWAMDAGVFVIPTDITFTQAQG